MSLLNSEPSFIDVSLPLIAFATIVLNINKIYFVV